MQLHSILFRKLYKLNIMTESHVLIIIFYTGIEESIWLEPTYNPPSSQIILHILISDCPSARRAKDVFSYAIQYQS